VTLLPNPDLKVYGNVNALRSELSELVFLARTYTTWGVKSLVSGPFGDEQFRDIMLICDRLLAFLHTPDDLMGYLGSGAQQALRRQSFAHTQPGTRRVKDLWKALSRDDPTLFQGSFGSNMNLWSHDVATSWGGRMWQGAGIQREREAAKLRNSRHQDILRACDVQTLALEVVVLDPLIAYKGSICTEAEKTESTRRLDMVKRAMLCVCVGFAAGNRANQALLFNALPQLQAQACPPNLQSHHQQSSQHMPNWKPLNPTHSAEPALQTNPMPQGSQICRWPSTVHDLAQLSIITILRNNSSLCQRAPKQLATMFALLAEQSPDCPSTSPALELLFVLTKSEEASLFEFQLHVCDLLLGLGLDGEPLVRLPAAVKQCVSAAAGFSRKSSELGKNKKNSMSSRLAQVVLDAKNARQKALNQSEAASSSGPMGVANEEVKHSSPIVAMDQGCETVLEEVEEISEGSLPPLRQSSLHNNIDPQHLGRDNPEPIDSVKVDSARTVSITSVEAVEAKVGNPARLLLLLSFVLDGGNERCAGLLKRSAGVTIDATFVAFLKAIIPSSAELPASPLSSAGTQNGHARWSSLRKLTTFHATLNPKEVLALMVAEGGVCSGLMALLVELVFVLPITVDQVCTCV
jgi:hypothetical protein